MLRGSIVPRRAIQARRHNMEAFEVVNRQTGDVVGTLYLTNDGDIVRFEPDLAPLDVKTNDRPVDDGLLAVLRKMRKGGWMMARAIRADSTQYQWLLRREYIHRRDAALYGGSLRKRWEYCITRQGLAFLSQHEA